MPLRDLAEHDFSTLYDHVLRDALVTTSHALRFYAHAVGLVSDRRLRDHTLSCIDRSRCEMDNLIDVIQTLGHSAFHKDRLDTATAREWLSLADLDVSSPRVRDFAIAASGTAICKYTDARFDSMIQVSEKMDSEERLDGLRQMRAENRQSEQRFTELQREL